MADQDKKSPLLARAFGFLLRPFRKKAKEKAVKGQESTPPAGGVPAAGLPPLVEKQAPPSPPERTGLRHQALSQGVSSLLKSAPAPKAPETGLGVGSFETQAPLAARPRETVSSGDLVRLLVVDDIAQTRETIIRSLRFQERIQVVGAATNGRMAIQLAKETKPDVILMDVNMPDMDGITATEMIRRDVPFAQIIILTVQDDVDYMRKAMLAGARDFLAKPPMIDDLVTAVLRAGQISNQEKEKAPPSHLAQIQLAQISKGKILTVYSPRGGSGCTMLAANLAATLHNDETPVLVVDGSLQYGDVPVFFNLQAAHSLVHLAAHAEELDAQLVEQVVVRHSSGIKVLVPPNPQESERIDSLQFTKTLQFLSKLYPYVIVDTAHRLSDITLAAIDMSDLVVLVTTQDIPSLARMRKFLDLAPALNLDTARILIVLNQYDKRVNIPAEKVAKIFRHPVSAVIPQESRTVIPSINRGFPFMLRKDALTRPVARAMLATVSAIRQQVLLIEQAQAQAQAETTEKSKGSG